MHKKRIMYLREEFFKIYPDGNINQWRRYLKAYTKMSNKWWFIQMLQQRENFNLNKRSQQSNQELVLDDFDFNKTT